MKPDYTLDPHDPKGIGWLLACEATSNMDKGKRLLSEVSPEIQKVAKEHARDLIALYFNKGNSQARASLVTHPYYDSERIESVRARTTQSSC